MQIWFQRYTEILSTCKHAKEKKKFFLSLINNIRTEEERVHEHQMLNLSVRMLFCVFGGTLGLFFSASPSGFGRSSWEDGFVREFFWVCVCVCVLLTQSKCVCAWWEEGWAAPLLSPTRGCLPSWRGTRWSETPSAESAGTTRSAPVPPCFKCVCVCVCPLLGWLDLDEAEDSEVSFTTGLVRSDRPAEF